MVKIITSITLFLFLTQGFSQSWNQKFNFPSTPRLAATGFSNGNYGYICGGSLDNNTHYTELWQYDPSIDRWFARSNFPGTARRNLISFTIDSLSYVGLGYNYSSNQLFNDIYAYNPNSDTWSVVSVFPGSLTRGTKSASLGGKGYAIGGTAARGSASVSNQLWEYNPVSNSWAQKAVFPGGARTGGVAFTSDSLFFYGLGHNHNVAFRDLWSYDPLNNNWTIVDSFPGDGRHNASVVMVNGKAIVGGGVEFNPVTHSDYYSYDHKQDSWTVVPSYSQGARSAAAGFSIGGKGYITTGWDSLRVNSLNDVWEYIDSSTIVTSLIDRRTSENQLSLFPNPTKGLISVKGIQNNGQILIYNAKGKLVLTQRNNSFQNNIMIDISNEVNGMYFYSIIDSHQRLSGKIILNN